MYLGQFQSFYFFFHLILFFFTMDKTILLSFLFKIFRKFQDKSRKEIKKKQEIGITHHFVNFKLNLNLQN